MLPKLWKKILLAVCIIACLFNIVSKFVNRNSLEINIKSANDGKTIWEALKKDEKEETKSNPEYIDDVKTSTNTGYNTEKNIVVEEKEEESYNSAEKELEDNEQINKEDANSEEKIIEEETNEGEVDTMNFKDNVKSVMKYFEN